MNIGKKIIDGTILFISVYGAAKGYQMFTKEYEKVVPASIDKVHMLGLVASMSKQNEES